MENIFPYRTLLSEESADRNKRKYYFFWVENTFFMLLPGEELTKQDLQSF